MKSSGFLASNYILKKYFLHNDDSDLCCPFLRLGMLILNLNENVEISARTYFSIREIYNPLFSDCQFQLLYLVLEWLTFHVSAAYAVPIHDRVLKMGPSLWCIVINLVLIDFLQLLHFASRLCRGRHDSIQNVPLEISPFLFLLHRHYLPYSIPSSHLHRSVPHLRTSLHSKYIDRNLLYSSQLQSHNIWAVFPFST